MAVRPEEIISKIIIDGSGAEEGTQRVAMSLNVMQNALSRALGGIDPLVKATMQFGREMTTLKGHIENVTTAQADLTKQSQSGATALKLLEGRQQVLLEMQKRLETGTISLGQAQAALSGKIKTAADFASYGQRAFLEFMAQIDKTAASELAQVKAVDEQKAKLAELRDVLKGAGLDLAAQEAAIKKVTAAYDPLTLKMKEEAQALQDVKVRLREYREELGLEDAALRKFEAGKKELLELLVKEGTGFAEATALLSAYVQAKDPAIQKDKEQKAATAALSEQLLKYKFDLGLLNKEEHDFVTGRDQLIHVIKETGTSFSEGAALLEAYARAHDPVLKADKDAAASAEKLTSERAKLKAAMLGELNAGAKTAEAQRAGYQQALAAVDPLYAATLNYENGLKKLREGQAASGKKAEELAADEEKLFANFEKTKKIILESEAAHRRLAEAGGLSRNSMLMLNASVINTVQSLSAGLPVTMVMMQQLPQIAGAFAQESTALGKVTASAVAFATANSELLIGLGGFTLGIGAAVAAQQAYASSIRELNLAHQLLNGSIGLSKSGLLAYADAQADAAGVSSSSARTMVAEFTKTGKIGTTVMSGLMQISRDYAKLTGTDVEEAGKVLAGLFSDPAKGAEELSSKIGLLTSAQLNQIRVLADSGDRISAQNLLLAELAKRTSGARDEASLFAQAWHGVATAISDAVDAFGRWVNKAAGGASLGDQIKDLQKQTSSFSILDAVGLPNPERQAKLALLNTLQTKQLEQLRLAQAQGLAAAEALASKAADDIAKTLKPISAEIEAAEARLATLNKGLLGAKNAPSANVPAAVNAAQNQVDDLKMLEKIGGGLDAATVKTKLLAEARVKAASMGEIAGKKFLATETARINALGTLTTTQQRTQEQQNAALGVTAELTAAVVKHNLTLTANAKALNAQAQAWESTIDVTNMAMQSYDAASADAILADARSRAENDALTEAINVTTRARQYAFEGILKQASGSAKTIAGMAEEVTQLEKVTAATKQGAQAREEAELAAQVSKDTQELRAQARVAELLGLNEEAERLQKLAERYGEVARAKKEAGFNDVLAKEGLKTDHDIELAREKSSLVGAPAETKMQVQAQREVLNLLYGQGKEYSKLTDAQKKQVDQLVKQKVELGQLDLAVQRQEDAWNTLSTSLENAFGKVGDAITEAFAKGEMKSLNWGNITKAVISSVLQDLIKLSLINPLKNAVFGTNSGTIFDLVSGGSQSGAGAAPGQSGTLSQASTLIQSGYSIYSGTNTLGSLASSAAMSSGGTALGLSAAGTGTGTVTGGAGVMGVYSSPAVTGLTSTGSSMVSGLSAVGAAAPYGMIGGLGGAYLSNTYMGGSKVGGAVTGAALGVGTYAAATAAGGAMAGTGAMAALSAVPVYGWIAAAVLAAVMAAVGSQKPSVGPNAQGSIHTVDGRYVAGEAAADNGGDATNVKNVTTTLAKGFNTLADTYKLKISGDFGYWEGGTSAATGQGVHNDPKQLIQQMVRLGLKADDPNSNVAKALASNAAQTVDDLEVLQKYLDVASKIDTATAAFAELNKSLTQVQATAKATAVESFKTVDDEIKTADKIGLGKEYRKSLEQSIRSTFEGAVQSLTPMEVAMAQLRGQTEAWVEAVVRWSAGVSEAEIRADAEAKAKKLREQALTEYTVALNEAQGRSYLAQIAEIKTNEDIVRRNLIAVGVGTDDAKGKASQLTLAQSKQVLDGLNLAQLKDVITQLGGSIGALAETMRAAAEATAGEDLVVRELRARGLDDQADMFTLQLKQRDEYSKAVTDGYSTEYLANLRRVQGLEVLAAAEDATTKKTKTLATALEILTATEDLAVRKKKAQGQTEDAATLERHYAYQRELVKAMTEGYGEEYIAELRVVQQLEEQAAVTAALAETAATATSAMDTLADSLATVAQTVLDAHNELALTPVTSLSKAYGTLGGTVTGSRIAMLTAGVDPNERPGLEGNLASYNSKALSGTLAASDLTTSISDLTTMLNKGKLAPTQYADMIDYVTQRFLDSQKALLTAAETKRDTAKTKRQGLLDVRETLGGGKRQFGQMMLDAGVDPSTYGNLRGDMDTFLAATRDGTATADDYAGAALRLTVALDNNRLTAEQYETLLGDLGTAYKDVTDKAAETKKAMKDLGLSIRNYLTDIQVGELSIKDPGEQRKAAKTAFNNAAALAAGGDTNAAGRLTELATTFLKASQAVYATSSGYVTDFNDVNSVLGDLADDIDAGTTPAQTTANSTTLSAARLLELNNAIELARTENIHGLQDVVSATTLLSGGLSAVRTALDGSVTTAIVNLSASTDNPISKPIVAAVDALRTGAIPYLELLVAGKSATPTALHTAVFGDASKFTTGGDPNKMLDIENGGTISQARRNAIARALGYTGEFENGKLLSYMSGNADWTKQFLAAVKMAANPGQGILAGLPGFASGTDNAPRGPILVGENGPELMFAQGGEKIIPAPQSARLLRDWSAPRAQANSGRISGGQPGQDWSAVVAGLERLAEGIDKLQDAVKSAGKDNLHQRAHVAEDMVMELRTVTETLRNMANTRSQ